ncbi:MAG: ACT domain-containing protein, partial [Synechococcaceae bacterium WB9_2_170]|nr:ACT domain-containing protein [Synechococcaceae bacterium WB9_2_170]
GPTASAVVADILNIAAIRQVAGPSTQLDPLLAAGSWRQCRLVDSGLTHHRNYVRFQAADLPGVIGHIGSCFGAEEVSLQSIVQFESEGPGAEIVVITHAVEEARFRRALGAILARPEVEAITSCLRTL